MPHPDYNGVVSDLFSDGTQLPQAPAPLGGVYTNRIPSRVTVVPMYLQRTPFTSFLGGVESSLQAARDTLLANWGQRTANAHRFSGTSSHMLDGASGMSIPTGKGPVIPPHNILSDVPKWVWAVAILAYFAK